MIQFLKSFFADSFGFNHNRFEELFFKNYGITNYRSLGYIDEHWNYIYNDVIFQANELECIVLLNKKEIFRIEFIHNMKTNTENLFFNVKKIIF